MLSHRNYEKKARITEALNDGDFYGTAKTCPGIPRIMEDDVTTSRHHYIPKFYLRGFTDRQGKFYRYDKLKDDYRYVGTKSIFWEENLNAGVLKHPETGEMHYFELAEHLFSGLESMLAKSIEILRNTDASTRIMAVPAAVETIKQLIHFLFWRVPSNKALLDKLMDEKTLGDLGFGFFDTNGKRLTEWEEKMKDIDLWRKMYPALIASGRASSSFKMNNDIHWDTYYMNWNHAFVTDNPVILRSFDGPASLEGNLLFPLSLNMLIVSLDGKKKPALAPMIAQLQQGNPCQNPFAADAKRK